MSTSQIALLAFVAGFAYFARRFLGDLYLERAIVLGPVTGLILGDLTTGLLVGAALELIFIGAADIGGSVPPNLPIGAVLGTAFAITSGLTPEQAMVLAVPAALLGAFGELLAKTFGTAFVNAAERAASRGNARGVTAMVHVGNLFHFLAVFIPAWLGLQLGSTAVEGLSNAVSGPLENGLTVMGAILPALGFGLLLNTLAVGALMPFFFLGFLVVAYTEFGVLGVAFAGFMIAAVWVLRRGPVELLSSDETERDDGLTATPAEQRRLFWRSFGIQSAFSFDRMQALGFTWALLPKLRQLYPDRTQLAKALHRHLVFFNTHPWLPGPILALTSDLEQRYATALARGDDVDEVSHTASVESIKGSLMGPLAGIGDSAFHGTLRPVLSGVGASLALAGNPIAPLVFLVPINAVHFGARWFSLRYGFRFGRRLFQRLNQDVIDRVMEGATIAGLMGVGALVGTWLNITVPVEYTIQESTVSLQEMLDGILPKLTPLLVTLAVFGLVRRQVNAVVIMAGLAVGGFVLGYAGVLGA